MNPDNDTILSKEEAFLQLEHSVRTLGTAWERNQNKVRCSSYRVHWTVFKSLKKLINFVREF